MSKQPEQILENQLIEQLQKLGYALVQLKDETALIANLKQQLEKHNNISFSDEEFKKVMNILTKGSVFVLLEPTRAWTSVHDMYHLEMQNLYKILTPYFTPERTKKVKCFKDYVMEVLDFIEFSDNFVMTRTGVIQSRFVTPLVSGMIIEIANASHGDDIIKEDRFFRDPNYLFYLDAAKRSGFKLDKNAPWRLVADIRSPAMIPFLQQNNIKVDDIFDDLFYKSYETDISVLKEYLRSFYNSFVELNPNMCPNSRQKKNKRLFMSKIELNDIDLDFWIRVYYRLRGIETGR